LTYLDLIDHTEYYLVHSKNLTKGKKQIKKQQVYALNHGDFVALTNYFVESLYGDAVSWLVFSEKKCTVDYFIFFDRSIQIHVKRKDIDTFLKKFQPIWLREIIGEPPIKLVNVINFYRENAIEITNSHYLKKIYRQIININNQQVTTLWMESENHHYELISLAP
jgi:hypothetical protein